MGRPQFSRSIQTRAISSVYGKIEMLLLAFPGKKGNISKADVLERYGSIFEAFNDRVTFVVMGDFGKDEKALDSSRKAFHEALLDSNIDPEHQLIFCHTPMAEVKSQRDGELHSEFIQDPFVVMESEYGIPVLLESYRQANKENSYVAEQLGAYADYLIQPTALEIEGGNILIGDDYALVGKNILAKNFELGKRMSPDNPEKWISNQLKQLLGVRFLIWVGLEKVLDLKEFHSTGAQQLQPFFHIDLFVTLAGKNREGQENIFLANLRQDQIEGAEDVDAPFLNEIEKALDETKKLLEEVGKNRPGPTFRISSIDMGGKIIDQNGKRILVPFSYLNAHIEYFQGFRRIYLPSFKSTIALESTIKENLKYDGFKSVVFVKGPFEHYAERHGSLHCISKVLMRSNF